MAVCASFTSAVFTDFVAAFALAQQPSGRTLAQAFFSSSVHFSGGQEGVQAGFVAVMSATIVATKLVLTSAVLVVVALAQALLSATLAQAEGWQDWAVAKFAVNINASSIPKNNIPDFITC